MNFDALKILVPKLRPTSNFSEVLISAAVGRASAFLTGMRTSCVSVVMATSVNRIASAP